MTIEIFDYQPEWAIQFQILSEQLRSVVGEFVSSIEHVGSTSVVGLSAKPIIDIDIVTSRDNLSKVICALENFGYKHLGNLGIEDREAFKNPLNTVIKHHLYVCIEESLGLKNHLKLRDSLKANPAKVEEYAKLKRQLASAHPNNMDAYVAGKTKFVLGILEESGFSERELSDIRDPNLNPIT